MMVQMCTGLVHDPGPTLFVPSKQVLPRVPPYIDSELTEIVNGPGAR